MGGRWRNEIQRQRLYLLKKKKDITAWLCVDGSDSAGRGQWQGALMVRKAAGGLLGEVRGHGTGHCPGAGLAWLGTGASAQREAETLAMGRTQDGKKPLLFFSESAAGGLVTKLCLTL